MALPDRERRVLRTGGDGRRGPRWLPLAQAAWRAALCARGPVPCTWSEGSGGGGSPHCPWVRGASCRPGDRGSHGQAGRGEGWPEPSQEGTPLRTGENKAWWSDT